ncbi:MAG: dTDP-4-dehydrorhamnose 3,5-epimerase family protein [Candidatus Omnitrophota bacterium]
MIEGVKIKKLKVIPDDRGRLMEILRCDDEIFEKFGQVYVTTAFPGVVKAWHYHKKQDDHFVCLNGKIKLALYDFREESSTKGRVDEFLLSLEDPFMVKIPRMVYHGFKCVSDKESMILNVPTMPYSRNEPDEFRIDTFDNDIPYDWGK